MRFIDAFPLFYLRCSCERCLRLLFSLILSVKQISKFIELFIYFVTCFDDIACCVYKLFIVYNAIKD